MPLLLFMGAIAVIVAAGIFLLWRAVDKRVRDTEGEYTLEDLAHLLETTIAEQKHLKGRVEYLEAIVVAEPLEDESQASDTVSRVPTR